MNGNRSYLLSAMLVLCIVHVRTQSLSDSERKPLNAKVSADSLWNKWNLNSGSLILPVKLRFGNGRERAFDFDADVMLGAAFSCDYRLKKGKTDLLSLVSSFGMSAVDLDSSSSKGRILEPMTQAAFSPAMGMLYSRHPLQVGVFCGMDYIGRPYYRDWMYQGDLWMALGLGLWWSRTTEKP